MAFNARSRKRCCHVPADCCVAFRNAYETPGRFSSFTFRDCVLRRGRPGSTPCDESNHPLKFLAVRLGRPNQSGTQSWAYPVSASADGITISSYHGRGTSRNVRHEWRWIRCTIGRGPRDDSRGHVRAAWLDVAGRYQSDGDGGFSRWIVDRIFLWAFDGPVDWDLHVAIINRR